MATLRPLKEGSVRTYQEKVALGFPDILASEMDADLDTIYAAWNTTAGGDLQGNYPSPTIIPAARSKWTDTGTVLTPTPAAYANLLKLDTTGTLTLQPSAPNSWAQLGLYGAGGAVGGVFKTFHARGSLAAPTPTQDTDNITWLSANGCWQAGSYSEQGFLRFVAAGGWAATSRGTSFLVSTTPVGSTAVSNQLSFDYNGNLVINGTIGQKASGTVWTNPSDRRIKKNIEPYARGLAAIVALEPKTFEFNGLGGSRDGVPGIGLIAEDVQLVMPEMVSSTTMKLNPDDADPVDLLTLDTTALQLALVNAVQELTARVVALEAR